MLRCDERVQIDHTQRTALVRLVGATAREAGRARDALRAAAGPHAGDILGAVYEPGTTGVTVAVHTTNAKAARAAVAKVLVRHGLMPESEIPDLSEGLDAPSALYPTTPQRSEGTMIPMPWHPLYEAGYPEITQPTGDFNVWYRQPVAPADYGITGVTNIVQGPGRVRVPLPPGADGYLRAALAHELAGQPGSGTPTPNGRAVEYAVDHPEVLVDRQHAAARILRAWLAWKKHPHHPELRFYFDQYTKSVPGLAAPIPKVEVDLTGDATDQLVIECLAATAANAAATGEVRYGWAREDADGQWTDVTQCQPAPPADYGPYCEAHPDGTLHVYAQGAAFPAGDSGLAPADLDALLEAFRLTVGDRRAITAFGEKRAEKGGPLLTTDGRVLEKLGLGRETVAKWEGGKVHLTSSQSVKSDETILRALRQAVPKFDWRESVTEAKPVGAEDPPAPLRGPYGAFRLNPMGGSQLALARPVPRYGMQPYSPANLASAQKILAKFQATNPDVRAHVRGRRPFYILLDEADPVSVATILTEQALDPNDPNRPLAKQYTQYVHHGNIFKPSGPGVFVEGLGRSAYRIVRTMGGIEFHRTKAKTDELYHFPNSVMEDVLAEIDQFWDVPEDYARFGMLHNRGILLEGGPGNGKSAMIQQVAEMMVRRGDVVFFATSIGALKDGLSAFRDVEPKRPVVVVLEDADEHLQYDHRQFLQLLDGDDAVEGVLYLATTNYLDRFPERLRRPGRFDKIVNVPPPPVEGRQVYLERKLQDVEKPAEIRRLALATEGMSFGHLREFIAAVYVLKNPKDEALRRLRAQTGISDPALKEAVDEAAVEGATSVNVWTVRCTAEDDDEGVALRRFFAQRCGPGAPILRVCGEGRDVHVNVQGAASAAAAQGYLEGLLPEFRTQYVADRDVPTVHEVSPTVHEVSPPGFSGTVKALKQHPELSQEPGQSPYALAWWMYRQGAKPTYAPEKGKPRYVTPAAYAKQKAERSATTPRRMAASADTVSTLTEATHRRVTEIAFRVPPKTGKLQRLAASGGGQVLAKVGRTPRGSTVRYVLWPAGTSGRAVSNFLAALRRDPATKFAAAHPATLKPLGGKEATTGEEVTDWVLPWTDATRVALGVTESLDEATWKVEVDDRTVQWPPRKLRHIFGPPKPPSGPRRAFRRGPDVSAPYYATVAAPTAQAAITQFTQAKNLNPAYFKATPVHEAVADGVVSIEEATQPRWVQDTLAALGGRRALFMLGAKDTTYDAKTKSVFFRIGRNISGANVLRLQINPATDLYNVTLDYRTKSATQTPKVKAEAKGLYADALRGWIEAKTGMRLSLGTMGKRESVEEAAKTVPFDPAAIAAKAETNKDQWGALFDRLKPNQLLYVATTSVMGMGASATGQYLPYRIGRRSESKKKYIKTRITLLPAWGNVGAARRMARVSLWKDKNGRVGASHGDMALFLKGLYAPPPGATESLDEATAEEHGMESLIEAFDPAASPGKTTSGKRIPGLNDPAYTKGYKFPKITGEISPARGAGFEAEAAKALRRNLPNWTKGDHRDASAAHDIAGERADRAWTKVRAKEHQRVFQRKPEFTDYKVSGIGRTEYSEPVKERLRLLAHSASKHRDLMRAHRRAAKLRGGLAPSESLDEARVKDVLLRNGHLGKMRARLDRATDTGPLKAVPVVGTTQRPADRTLVVTVQPQDADTVRRWAVAQGYTATVQEHVADAEAADPFDTVSTAVGEGRTLTPKYVLDLYGYAGVRASTPIGWSVKQHGKPTDANVQRWVARFNQSLAPGGANAHLGRAARAVGGVLRRNTGFAGQIVARWGTVPSPAQASADETLGPMGMGGARRARFTDATGRTHTKGETVRIPGFADYTFVVVPPSGSRAKHNKRGWAVHEYTTGAIIHADPAALKPGIGGYAGPSAFTREHAIAQATKILQHHGLAKFQAGLAAMKKINEAQVTRTAPQPATWVFFKADRGEESKIRAFLQRYAQTLNVLATHDARGEFGVLTRGTGERFAVEMVQQALAQAGFTLVDPRTATGATPEQQRFPLGTVVHFRGQRRRYVVIDHEAHTGWLGLVALSGGERGSFPTGVDPTKVQRDADQTKQFVGAVARQLHRKFQQHVRRRRVSGGTVYTDDIPVGEAMDEATGFAPAKAWAIIRAKLPSLPAFKIEHRKMRQGLTIRQHNPRTVAIHVARAATDDIATLTQQLATLFQQAGYATKYPVTPGPEGGVVLVALPAKTEATTSASVGGFRAATLGAVRPVPPMLTPKWKRRRAATPV